nr:hypothetical protein [Tanacetum cinerariifolium]
GIRAFGEETLNKKNQLFLLSWPTLQATQVLTQRQKLEKAEQERDDLKLKLEKFETSFNNLAKLIGSQLDANNKTVLDMGTGQRETRPVWDNTARVNHQNKLTHPHPQRNFVPAAIFWTKSQEAGKGVKSKNTTHKNSKGWTKMADQEELIPPLKKLVWVRRMHPNRGGKMIQMKNLMLLMRNNNKHIQADEILA